MKLLNFLAVTPLIMGAGFVELTEEGSKVREATSDQVISCKTITKGSSSTRAKRIFFGRKGEKVQKELIELAKNEAATRGANVIVPKTISSDGKMEWTAYSCD